MTEQEFDLKVKEIATKMANTTMKYVRKAYWRGIAIGFLLGLLVSLIVKYIT